MLSIVLLKEKTKYRRNCKKKNVVIPAKAGIHNTHNIDLLMKTYYVYIMASKKNGTLYIGVTNDLIKRVYEHKYSMIEGFTKKYNVDLLVYYESYRDIYLAIQREKRIKKWNRAWKVELIEKNNPEWRDLYDELQ